MNDNNNSIIHGSANVAATTSNNYSNVNTNTSTSNTHDTLESKIQSVAASYRQKRDEAHRTHQLALERLKLVQEEADALSATVVDLNNKLTTLHQQGAGVSTSSSSAKEELQKLYNAVDQLTKEFKFQHQELVQKRSKNEETKESLTATTKKYDSVRGNIEHILHGRRLQIANEQGYNAILDSEIPVATQKRTTGNDANFDPAGVDSNAKENFENENHQNNEQLNQNQNQKDDKSSMKRRLQDELNWSDRDGERFVNKLPSIVQSVADSISSQGKSIYNTNKSLERVVKRYEASCSSSSLSESKRSHHQTCHGTFHDTVQSSSSTPLTDMMTKETVMQSDHQEPLANALSAPADEGTFPATTILDDKPSFPHHDNDTTMMSDDTTMMSDDITKNEDNRNWNDEGILRNEEGNHSASGN